MPKYEICERKWPDEFNRQRLLELWHPTGLKPPWGLYRDGVIIGLYETKEEAEAILAELPTEKEEA